MALIYCTECGKQISDKAKACVHCGCPIENIVPEGMVKIKLSVVKSPVGLNGKQRASIMIGGNVVWQGFTGEIAELFFGAPTRIVVKYHFSMMHYGGECSGIIDPVSSKKYCVSTRVGMMSTKLVLQQVDVFDAD